jgi:hypothetical protein
MKKVLIEEWVLKVIWGYFPHGAARNQLASHEMVKFVREWDTHALQKVGCSCKRPLLGYRPGVGPRCRLCNTVAKEEQNEDTSALPD